jgi:hypothetical protein
MVVWAKVRSVNRSDVVRGTAVRAVEREDLIRNDLNICQVEGEE